MKTEIKIKWMTLAIIILLMMNVSTVITVIYIRNKAVSENTLLNEGQGPIQATTIKYSGRYFRDQLGFSSQQMAQFREFNPQFRKSVMNINIELDRLREKMLNEMAGEKCSNARLEMMADSIGTLHATLKKETYKYYLNLKEICNQQQKEKLEQMFSEMFVSDFRQGRHGKGNKCGRQVCN